MTRRPPKLRTPENASRICGLLAEGISLRQIAKELHIESAGSITDWARDDAEFAVQYARGMELRCHRLADELLELADTPCLFDGRPDNALVQQLRVQIDARKWLLSKLLPRKYGDRITQAIETEDGSGPITVIQLIPIDPPRGRLEADAEVASGGEASVMPLRVLSR
jgi:hypothetical protein